MDPLTHGLLGACVGQTLYGRSLGRPALVWGAVLGMAPDLDILARPADPLAEWIWHRGFTHALWFGPVVGGLVGYALWRWKGGALSAWLALAVMALLTHPLLDLFTSWGTQLLAPFSNRRFALDAVAIIDPAYSLVLAAGIALGLRAGLATATRAARRGRGARALVALPRAGARRERADRGAGARRAARPGDLERPTSPPTRRCSSFRIGASSRAAATRCAWAS